jgi:hypothetical protein
MIDPLSLAISEGTAHPYHEAFWVVVGTAAPVITLAAIVATGHLRFPEGDYVERVVLRPTLVKAVMLAACMGAQVTVLAVTLQSLRQERDTNLIGATVAIILGLLLLAVEASWTAFLTPTMTRGTRSREAEQSEPDAASAETNTLPKPSGHSSGE